jgi:1-acyl-sn-glycerol-3-phosphate acyltransferase
MNVMQDAPDTITQCKGSALAQRLLRLIGWRPIVASALPEKAIVVAYPHTSNWDFPLGIVGRAAVGLETGWVAKDTLFRWPLGWLMRALGGIPVNRRQHTGFVQLVAERFANSERLRLAIAPEGTRSLTPGWKSGFYRIALAAQVPLVLAVIDYRRREVGVLCRIDLSGDEAADMARIASAYAGRQGRYPEKQSPVALIAR